MWSRVSALAFGATLAASTVQAQTPATPPTEVSGVTVQAPRLERTDTADQMMRGRNFNPHDRVCRRITATGSRLGARRVCQTRAEWDAAAGNDRTATDQIQRQTRMPGG